MIEVILLGITLLLVSIHWFWTRNFNYWQIRNIPGPKPHPFYGNTKSFYSNSSSYCLETEDIYRSVHNWSTVKWESITLLNKSILRKYKDKSAPLVGYYAGRTPHLLATDLFTVNEILARNFHYFADNEACDMMSTRSDPIISRNPFFQKKATWKPNRQQLSPAFSKNRIKSFYPIMQNVCEELCDYLDKIVKKLPSLEIEEVSECVTVWNYQERT